MAQVFELHFNPKLKEDQIFESFCYEPENVYERRLGSLYMAGELKNALPPNYRFLNNLAQIIKGSFYSFPVQATEKSFKKSLKKANEFLEKEVEKNNTRWMGHLNFAVLSLKKFNLNFTKVGNVKILLLRAGKIIDIGKELELQEIEPYPLKIFSNVVSGTLSKDDIILVATKEVFSIFSQEKANKQVLGAQSILYKIATLASFEEKKLKKILKEKEKEISEISGICLLIVLKPKVLSKIALSFEKAVPLVPIGEVFQPVLIKIKKIFTLLKKSFTFLPKIQVSLTEKIIKLPKITPFIKVIRKIKNFPSLFSQKISEKIENFKKIISSRPFKKRVVLVSALIFFLLLGFFVFKREKEIPLKKAKEVFPQIQEKMDMAENFLVLKEERKANSLLQEAWEEILPMAKKGASFEREARVLKEAIEEKLFTLNKLEKIKSPELLFEFSKGEFLPQKMVNLDKTLYFFNSNVKSVYKFKKGEKIKIEAEEKFDLATPFDENSILFFAKVDKLIFLTENKWGQTISLALPYSDFHCNDLSSFSKNVYLLDSKKGEIIKYNSPLVIGKIFPKYWLNRKTKKPIGAKDMVIDGSIWILTSNNEIDRYYVGRYQETLILDFFPSPQNIDKILINRSLPYLFLLESEQNRIIILDKAGNIVKQFQSKKFDELKDFSVSEDGTIYLLNGQKVYQIKF